MSLSCPLVRKVGLGPKPITKRLPLTPCSETHVSEFADDKVSEPSVPGTKSSSSRLGQAGHGEEKCKASLHIFCDDFCNCSSVSFKEDDESDFLDNNLGGGSLLQEKGYEPFEENKPFEESEPEEELDPEEVYDLEEEYNPKEECDPEEVYDLEEEYSPKEECDPEEDYDPEEAYDPEEDYDPEEEYDPEEDDDPEEEYDPEKACHPEEDGLFCSDKLEPARASTQNEVKACFELEDHRVSEEKAIVSNLGMRGMTVVVNEDRGYVEKEIIDIDSDDPEEDCCAEEEHDPEDGLFCSNKLEHAHASTQTEGTAGFELEDQCASEEKATASNLGMEGSTDIVNEDIGYVKKEIIDVDSDDQQHVDGFGDETSNAGKKECVEIVREMDDKRIHEIFLEGFDSNATKDDIKKSFGELGKVVNIKLMTDPQRNKNKVFAILSFATAEQADHAIINLRRPVINGKRCDTYPADPTKCNHTLFLGNVCKKWTKETLEEKLKHFGIKKFKGLRLAEDTSGAGLKCGYAFLELHSQSDAMSAYKRLQQRDVVLGADRSAKVCFAFPFVDLDDNTGTQVTRVFLDELPVSWDYSHVREHLEKFGQIKKIELARYMPSALRKDFGFVTYECHIAAAACLEFLDRARFHEGEKEVKIKAMLSHPLAERTSKHQICGNFPVNQEPASRDVRGSQGPSLTSRRHRHRTEKGRPQKESFGACSHKRAVGFRDRRQCESLRRKVRPLPSWPVQMRPNPKKSTEYDPRDDRSYGRTSRSMGPRNSFVMPRDSSFSQVRNLYEEKACGQPRSWNSAGVSTSTSRPRNLRSDVDAACGKSYARTLPYCTERHATDNASLSGSKRSYSPLDDVPPRYSNKHSKVQKRTVQRNWSSSHGRQSTAYSEHVMAEMEHSYSDIHQNRPGKHFPYQEYGPEFFDDRRHFPYQEYNSESVDDRRHFPHQEYKSESVDDSRHFHGQESQALYNIHRDERYSQYMSRFDMYK